MSTPGAKGRTGNWGMGIEGEYMMSPKKMFRVGNRIDYVSPYILDFWCISLD